jgi:hypothetical protein
MGAFNGIVALSVEFAFSRGRVLLSEQGMALSSCRGCVVDRLGINDVDFKEHLASHLFITVLVEAAAYSNGK